MVVPEGALTNISPRCWWSSLTELVLDADRSPARLGEPGPHRAPEDRAGRVLEWAATANPANLARLPGRHRTSRGALASEKIRLMQQGDVELGAASNRVLGSLLLIFGQAVCRRWRGSVHGGGTHEAACSWPSPSVLGERWERRWAGGYGSRPAVLAPGKVTASWPSWRPAYAFLARFAILAVKGVKV